MLPRLVLNKAHEDNNRKSDSKLNVKSIKINGKTDSRKIMSIIKAEILDIKIENLHLKKGTNFC